MTELRHTSLPDDHPWSMYLNNLGVGESITWYTTEGSIDDLIAYVLGLLNLERTELQVDDAGFYSDSEGDVLLMCIGGPWGSGLTAWSMGESGNERINNAINSEWDVLRESLSTGNYSGNPAQSRYAIMSKGELTPDWDGSPLIDYINDSQPVHLWSFMRD